MDKVYLDACCVNRPFDDQKQERIRLEAEAVLLILKRLQQGQVEWIGSSVLNFEVVRTPDPERRRRVLALVDFATLHVTAETPDFSRARELHRAGFKAFDALHLACAEKAGCNVFLTTDDQLLRSAARNTTQLRVRVLNPTDWLKEAPRL